LAQLHARRAVDAGEGAFEDFINVDVGVPRRCRRRKDKPLSSARLACFGAPGDARLVFQVSTSNLHLRWVHFLPGYMNAAVRHALATPARHQQRNAASRQA
jgi:hypothetical protein